MIKIQSSGAQRLFDHSVYLYDDNNNIIVRLSLDNKCRLQ